MSLNLRLAKKEDLNFLKNCWKICFEDSDNFINWHFDNNFNFRNTVVAEYGQALCAAAYVTPYNLKFNKEQLPFYYIFGVGTLPQYRGLGIASALMDFITTNKGLNIKNSFLISDADDLYVKNGYKKIDKRCIYTCPTENFSENSITKLPKNESELTALINKLDSLYEYHTADKISVKRTTCQWRNFLTELTEISGGKLILTQNGYTAVYPHLSQDSDLNKENKENILYEVWENIGFNINNNFKIINKQTVMAKYSSEYNHIFENNSFYTGNIL